MRDIRTEFQVPVVCAGSSEPLLLADVISTKFSCTGSLVQMLQKIAQSSDCTDLEGMGTRGPAPLHLESHKCGVRFP